MNHNFFVGRPPSNPNVPEQLVAGYRRPEKIQKKAEVSRNDEVDKARSIEDGFEAQFLLDQSATYESTSLTSNAPKDADLIGDDFKFFENSSFGFPKGKTEQDENLILPPPHRFVPRDRHNSRIGVDLSSDETHYTSCYRAFFNKAIGREAYL
jgi:hypothetical protein